MFKKYTNLIDKNNSNRGQSNSLPIMCILPLQRGRFVYFGLMGSHNQLCTFHSDNLLVTNLFYFHAKHWMIKAARWDKNGVLQSVPWSDGCSLSDVTSASHGSPNQAIRHSQEDWSVFLIIFLPAEKCKASQCLRTVSGLVITLRQRILKLYEALWRHCEIVLKTGLRQWTEIYIYLFLDVCVGFIDVTFLLL